jgi:hypothetical protein
MHALVASPYKSAYNAAKHGIAGFTKTVALETAQQVTWKMSNWTFGSCFAAKDSFLFQRCAVGPAVPSPHCEMNRMYWFCLALGIGHLFPTWQPCVGS